jgi:hypothetical protein
MPDIATGALGAVSLFNSSNQADAAQTASDQQVGVAREGMALNQANLEKFREILKPYTDSGINGIGGMQGYATAGMPAMQQQMSIAGLNGAGSQQAMYDQIANSPQLQAMMRQGENAMLQNASATGGLRGGNLQGALAQFRPAMLNQAVNQQYDRLGGFANMGLGINQNLAQLGQASAAGVGGAGLQTTANQGGLLSQIGAAQAGGTLGQSAALTGLLNTPWKMQGMGLFGGKLAPQNGNYDDF